MIYKNLKNIINPFFQNLIHQSLS